MEVLIKLVTVVACLGALAYCGNAIRRRRVRIMGVTYSTRRPTMFALSVAMIATIALMLLAFALVADSMLSALNIGTFRFLDGMAALLRVLMLFCLLFVSLLLVAYSRARKRR